MKLSQVKLNSRSDNWKMMTINFISFLICSSVAYDKSLRARNPDCSGTDLEGIIHNGMPTDGLLSRASVFSMRLLRL